ncbi:hypothetical protein UlMin_008098 [Ulmus minor]
MASKLEGEQPELYISEEWMEAADTIAYDSETSPPPIVFICGAKNSGKTTFSRYLLNVLLQRYRKVAYLDTDVGQSEFTTPGFLSLTTVDKDELPEDMTTLCMKTPERSFFFGDVSSKRDPAAYLNYIHTLYDYYKKEYCSPSKTELPLVINTPGWVKGVGYDNLVDMLKYIAPTHVVKINISAENKNLPHGAFWLDSDEREMVNLIEIKPSAQDNLDKSGKKDATQLRDLRIKAYFRQCFPKNHNITLFKELAYALTSHPPYEVPISSIKIKHLFCKVPSNEIYYSLNASIVGLAVSSEVSGNLPLCVGLGIVRGIDTFKGVLYIITPVPPSTLEKVDLFLQGFVQIPTDLLQYQGCVPPYMSTNVFSAS